MRTKTLAVALFMLCSAAVISAQDLKLRGTIWVTNRTTNLLTAIDASSGRILATVSVDSTPNPRPPGYVAGQVPHDIQVPCKTGRIYVSNEEFIPGLPPIPGLPSPPTFTISVINKPTMTVFRAIKLPMQPFHMSASPDGDPLMVTMIGDPNDRENLPTNRIAQITTLFDTAAREFETSTDPTAQAWGIWVSLDEKIENPQRNETVYVTNRFEGRSGTLVTMGAISGQIGWTLPVGLNPGEVVVTEDQSVAYVSVTGENRVKAIDVDGRAIRTEYSLPGAPDMLALTKSQKQLWVSLAGSPARVAVLNVKDANATAEVVNLAGDHVGDLHLSSNDRYLFATVSGSRAGVAVLDTRTRQVVAFYDDPLGGEPHGVFFEPNTWYDAALFTAAGCR